MTNPAPQLTVARPEPVSDHREDRWRALARFSVANALVAVIAGLVTGALAAGVVLGQPDSYRSQATLVIDSPAELAAALDDGVITKLSRLRLKYATLAGTPVIAEPVARAAGQPVGVVYRDARVELGGESLVLNAVATSGDPVVAQRLAGALAAELKLYVEREHEANAIAPDRRFRFDVVAAAHDGVKVAPTVERAAAVAALAAAVAALACYAFVQLIGLPGLRRP